MESSIFWSVMDIEQQKLYIAATTEGLCYVGGPNEGFNDMQKWLSKHFKGYVLIDEGAPLEKYIEVIQAYIVGTQKTLDISLHIKGTEFQMAVWQVLRGIPYGETVTYGYVAEKIGKPRAVRAVGRAIGANPVMIIVPCHRVIGKNGTLTGFRGGLEMKTYLLELERRNK